MPARLTRPTRLIAVFASLLTASVTAQSLPSFGQSFAVRFVIDGDTLEVAGAGRVRLLGIDAPELGSGFETPAPFAREARERLASLAHRQWVRLEGDDEKRDSYGRALAYVFRTDGMMLNAEMLRAGLARVSARRSLRHLGELRRAEEEAQRARRGVWGERPSIPARSFRLAWEYCPPALPPPPLLTTPTPPARPRPPRRPRLPRLPRPTRPPLPAAPQVP